MAAVSPHSYPVGDQEKDKTVADAAASPDVTRHIRLKSSHSTQVLEKAVVLRRIRQRKRVNKFQAVVGALFSSPFGDKTGEARQRKWVDEPFTSL
ncbi:hypothetical protein SDJN02_17225, partial [Cucurbita argyrosperma subsp. argyrosperma]